MDAVGCMRKSASTWRHGLQATLPEQVLVVLRAERKPGDHARVDDVVSAIRDG